MINVRATIALARAAAAELLELLELLDFLIRKADERWVQK